MINKTKFVAINQFGEKSINFVPSDETPYNDVHSFQVLPIDLNLAVAAGSNDLTKPKFLSPIMGNIIGASLTHDANYLGGLIGAFSITGTKATHYPAGAVLGIIMDGVTAADGAFVAEIDGDSGVVTANAAFKAMMKNSNAGSGFTYGLDLYSPAADSYLALAILNADIRMSNEVCIFSSSTVPTTAGSGFAGTGSICIARDTGKAYLNGGTKTTPSWKIITSA